MLSLYVDECVDARVVAGLRRRGVDIVTVADRALLGESDELHPSIATELRRIVVTADQDFLRLAQSTLEGGGEFSGLIFVLPATPVGDAVRGILLVATVMQPEEMKNWMEWVP